ncbi:MAG: SDR family oxidoreductase [Chloroflexota bacterium]
MLLSGKVAVITGAATGMGQTGAGLFAREGAKIIIGDINDEDGEATAASIRQQGHEALFVHTDVVSVSAIEDLVRKAVEAYGRLDIYWHNAGFSLPGHIDKVEEADFDMQIAVILRAAVFGTKFAVREMRKAGGGCLLFTSSMVGLRPHLYNPSYPLPYMLAKAGQVMLVRALTEPLSKDNIRVNCICPGVVMTPRSLARQARVAEREGITAEEWLKIRTGIMPLGRGVTMDEIAEAALFLVSDRAANITGVALPIDGGYTAV